MDRLGKGQVTAELLQPDELISGMMAQVAAEPDMSQLLTGFIYSSEGAQLEGARAFDHSSTIRPQVYVHVRVVCWCLMHSVCSDLRSRPQSRGFYSAGKPHVQIMAKKSALSTARRTAHEQPIAAVLKL